MFWVDLVGGLGLVGWLDVCCYASVGILLRGCFVWLRYCLTSVVCVCVSVNSVGLLSCYLIFICVL